MKMKILFPIAVVVLLASTSCTSTETNMPVEETIVNSLEGFAVFGDTISPDGAISAADMLSKYEAMEEGDTLEVKFLSVIDNVCQAKGCWMNLELSDEESAYIRFKDYGFFMPLNSSGSEAVAEGKAFVSVRSVEALQHDAEDEGLSAEEIAAITEPEVTYSFTAHGVLIKE
jgi:hypothetical protein